MAREVYCDLRFASLALIMIISNCFYALSAPFLPPVFESKRIPPQYVGFVFAAFSVATVIFSPYVSKIIEDHGQAKLIGTALFLMGVSVFCFGFLEQQEGPAWIIILAILLRFLQGK